MLNCKYYVIYIRSVNLDEFFIPLFLYCKPLLYSVIKIKDIVTFLSIQ